MRNHNLMDSRFFSLFTKLADLILLNFIFLLTCLPIVTIGASCMALYQVSASMADKRESYILHSFLAEWKKNFKQGTMVWAVCAFLLFLCQINLSILPSMAPGFAKIFLVCFQFVTMFILYGTALYSFSMPPIYRPAFGSMLKNALVLLFKYLPYTLLCLCIHALPFTVSLLVPKWAGLVLSIFMTVGFSAIAYIQSLVLIHVFNKQSCNKLMGYGN